MYTYPNRTLFLIVDAQDNAPGMKAYIGQEAYGRPSCITAEDNEWYILEGNTYYWHKDWLIPIKEKETVIEEDEYDRLFV